MAVVSAPTPACAEAESIIAKDARVAGDRERTRFIADLSKKVDVHVFALGNPYRVIVDAPDVNFQMPDGSRQGEAGPDHRLSLRPVRARQSAHRASMSAGRS